MNIDDDLKILETAKLLCGSNDINVIIDTAKNIKQHYLTTTSTLTTATTAQSFTIKDFAILSDVVSFAKACAIQHPVNGCVPFELYPFQEETLREMTKNNRLTLINSARQMGMTTILAVYALFEAATKPNQAILVCANKLAHAIEIMDRIRFSYQNLPNSIRPGVIEYNKNTISFDNGSRIIARGVSENAARGLSLTHILVDQAAFISYKAFESFWSATMPCMATGSKAIIQSTPRYTEGKFYDLCKNAPANGAHLIVIPWHKHPDRDEAWANRNRESFGETSWRMEFECEFIQRVDE